MDSQDRYWFPAKRYGWGWGLPTRWEGWATLAGFVVSLALVFYFLPPASNLAVFVLSIMVLTAVLMAVCWFKGEPPRWRCGG